MTDVAHEISSCEGGRLIVTYVWNATTVSRQVHTYRHIYIYIHTYADTRTHTHTHKHKHKHRLADRDILTFITSKCFSTFIQIILRSFSLFFSFFLFHFLLFLLLLFPSLLISSSLFLLSFLL